MRQMTLANRLVLGEGFPAGSGDQAERPQTQDPKNLSTFHWFLTFGCRLEDERDLHDPDGDDLHANAAPGFPCKGTETGVSLLPVDRVKKFAALIPTRVTCPLILRSY
jgi:hypothetical protein